MTSDNKCPKCLREGTLKEKDGLFGGGPIQCKCIECGCKCIRTGDGLEIIPENVQRDTDIPPDNLRED